jgi:hypothetical protein
MWNLCSLSTMKFLPKNSVKKESLKKSHRNKKCKLLLSKAD